MQKIVTEEDRTRIAQEYRQLEERYTAKKQDKPVGVDGSKSSNAIRFRPPFNQRFCFNHSEYGNGIYLKQEGWYVDSNGIERCRLCHRRVRGSQYAFKSLEDNKKIRRLLENSHCVVIYTTSRQEIKQPLAAQIKVKKAR